MINLLTDGARPLWALLLVALAVYAVTLADAYAIRLLTFAGIWALLGIGYQLVFGHAGALSLAQGGFYGLGAYAAALAATRLGLPFAAALALAIVLPAVLAALVGSAVLRLETHYFALASLGIAQVIHLAAVNWESLTGGANGIAGLPAPSVTGATIAPGGLAWLALVWLAVGLAGWSVTRIVDGLAGRTLTLLREHPLAAAALGIDAGRVRLAAFVCGAALAGLAGALAAHTAGVVSPDVTDLPVMVMCLTLVVVGGHRNVAGAILGALLLTHLPEWFRGLDRFWLAAYGAATLAIIIVAPAGIAGSIDAWLRQRRSLRIPPAPATGASAAEPVAELQGGSAGSPVLTVDAVHKSFGGVRALDGVSFALQAGEILGVIGPNGSGKTTLINLISGLEHPDSGRVLLAGEQIDGRPAHDIARRGVARSFQNLALPERLSTLDAVAVADSARLLGRRPVQALARALLARGDDPALIAARRHAGQRLAAAGIADLAPTRCGALPHGRRRLVEVARASMAEPRVLLLDEPAAGLGADERRQLEALLRSAAAGGQAILIVEHALDFLLPLADRVICLDRGRIAAQGAPEDLRADPRLATAYFGLPPVDAAAVAP